MKSTTAADALSSQDAEDQYQLLFEVNLTPMMIYYVATLRFLEVSTAAIAQYGYSLAEFLDLQVRDIRPPSIRMAAERVLEGWGIGRSCRKTASPRSPSTRNSLTTSISS